jgi:hypothetical protein
MRAGAPGKNWEKRYENKCSGKKGKKRYDNRCSEKQQKKTI